MNTLRHLANRSLPVSGQYAFVRAADAMAVAAKSEPHSIHGPASHWLRGEKDRMHPGKGGA